MRFLLAILVVAFHPALAASKNASVIPQQFRGEWHADPSSCGNGEDESFLFIGPRSVTYYESSGPVRAAVVRKRDLALILELSGEGDTWLDTAQFELSPDGKTLTSRVASGDEYIRHLCPNPQERPNKSFKPNPLRGSA
jgi:hypothetical protein